MRMIILISLLFIACTPAKAPTDILPPDKMKVVFFDLVRADEFANNFIANDTSKNLQVERAKLYQKVFVLHKTTKDEFYKSYKYYQQNPDKHKQLFDSLLIYSRATRDKPTIVPGSKIKPN